MKIQATSPNLEPFQNLNNKFKSNLKTATKSNLALEMEIS